MTLFPILYKAFMEKDMSLLEVNPLIVMTNGRLRVLDAKVSFDGNALFRHDDVMELRDTTEEDAKEIEASKYDLAYVALEGNIGCMVNGAGLAMATMDIIKLYGARSPPTSSMSAAAPAKEKVTAAFQDHHRTTRRSRAFWSTFLAASCAATRIARRRGCGGQGSSGVKVPLVVRLEGTNVDQGQADPGNESGLDVIAADNLDDAAQKVVKAVKGRC